MLKNAFSFSFNHRVVRNGADIGRFGGDFSTVGRPAGASNEPQIVVATDTNKVLLQNAESVFHVPEAIICVAVYPLPASSFSGSGFKELDAVLVGTRSSLTAFDIYNNKTLFHRDMPEGVSCIRVGHLDSYKEPVLVCGCGTTVWGLRADGTDLFWTALGDDVNALELCDMDGDGQNELLVGSNGVEIKVFKNTTFLNEFDEGDATIALCTIRAATFAFGLSSGVVGVYRNGERYWRVKTKSSIVSLLPFPDEEHIACVWQNGKIDIRVSESGDILCKEQVDGSGDIVAAVLVPGAPAFGLQDGMNEKQLALIYRNGKGIAGGDTDAQKLMREYGQRKHNLLEELKNLELRERAATDPNADRSLVPANTNLECGLNLTVDRGLCLRLGVSNDVPIKAVLLFAEGIFDTECYTIHPTGEESSQLSAYFSPTKDVVTELFIKVFAGFSSENQLHVFEVNQVLPKFVTFLRISSNTNFPEIPQSVVEFNMHVRFDRLGAWLSEKFLEPEPGTVDDDSNYLKSQTDGAVTLKFICTRNNSPLILQLRNSGASTLHHNNIESAANVLQSLCSHMNVNTLECRAYFPDVLKSVEDNMDEKYAVIERLSSDWAERLNVVRECVVRAEDALNIKKIATARKFYVRVAMLNRELVGQQAIRLNLRQELLNAIKVINLAIEQFSRLRVGEPASKLIKECRKAVAEENTSILPKLLQFGV